MSEDPTHKWIGSYNGRQMILNKFFRWLYSPKVRRMIKNILSPTLGRPAEHLENLLLFGSVEECVQKIHAFSEAGS